MIENSKLKSVKILLDFIAEAIFPTDEQVEQIERSSKDSLIQTLPTAENPPPRCFAIFNYSDERVKNLVWEIKYYRNTKVAGIAGQLIAERILAQTAGNRERFLLVPVPMTNKRLKERGFHHTELLAKAILKNLPPYFELANDLVKKTKQTPNQSSIESFEERSRNIAGAFVVSKPEKANRANIIVIDDVITTGATATEAMRVLSLAGARNLATFAIAH